MATSPARTLNAMRPRRVDSEPLDDVSTTLSDLTLDRAEPLSENDDPLTPRDAPVSTSAYSMAANLLDDVLVLILEELGRPAHTPEAYRDRQDALRRVCLASRRLLRLARPLLWRQVAVRSRKQLTLLKSAWTAAFPNLGMRTRFYTVVGSGPVNLAEGIGAASLLRNVVEMRLTSAPLVTFRLASLEQFPCLRRLHLGLAHLPRDTSATLPALEELCIRQVWSTSGDVQAQLQPARLPRLRKLFFVQVQDLGPSVPLQLDQVLSPALLPQLDLVQTDSASIDPTSDLAQGLDPPVLVFGPPPAGPPRPLPRHSISQPARFKDTTTATGTLTKLDASIRLVPPRPSHDPPYLLLLPTSLRTLAAAEPTIAPQLQALEALCVQSRVRIEWIDELPDGELVSPEFRRIRLRLCSSSVIARRLVDPPSSSSARVVLIMLARLVDDVLVMILDELALPAHTQSLYRTRQETLRSVCLASRKLRRLAQPLLWAQVIIRSREQLDRVVATGSSALRRCVKVLTVVASWCFWVDEVLRQLSILPEVVELRIASSYKRDGFNFALLGQCRNLHRLRVKHARLLEGPCVTLPALEELCLYRASPSSAWVRQQLQAAYLPRLRELYLVELPGMSSVRLDENVSPDVLRHLDILQVDDGTVSADGELVQAQLPPVLVSQFEVGTRRLLPRHTICPSLHFCSDHDATICLSSLAERVKLASAAPSIVPPRLLVLPTNLRRFVVKRPPVAQLLRVVEGLCVENGVRVMWDDEQAHGELISPAFRRYMRELREARALER